MASSGNFPLWSPLIKGATNLSLGNTRFDGSTNSKSAATSFAVPIGTKFYVECLVKQLTNYNIVFGLVSADQAIDTYLESQSSINGFIFHGYNASNWYTQALVNGSRQGFSSNVGLTSARVLAMTINRVDHEIKCYLDNSLITNGTISISATEEYRIFASYTGGTNSGVHMNINCGHDSTGAGDFSAGGNADENGFGDFQYSPPSGFLAPSSANLPVSDDIDPAQTDDNIPQKQFNTVLFDGNGSTNAVTGLGFQPDLIWGFTRSGSQSKRLVDSTRGGSSRLYSDSTSSESTGTATISSFDSDGFTATGGAFNNDSGKTCGAWCWKANGGTTTSDSSGDITVTRQTNDVAKFSILTYTGNGSSGSTIAHGLGVKPAMTIIKQRNSSNGWNVWHQGNNNGDYDSFGELNGTASWYQNQGSNGPFSAAPGTDYLTLTAYGQVNGSSNTYVSYIWADVEGMQKFGSFEGNANNDGPFIYTGFRPRMVFIKSVDTTAPWMVWDTARATFNVINISLAWNDSLTESDYTGYPIDVLSNGFKIRTSNATVNASGTWIFGAWGDVPFKYNNTF